MFSHSTILTPSILIQYVSLRLSQSEYLLFKHAYAVVGSIEALHFELAESHHRQDRLYKGTHVGNSCFFVP